MSNNVKVGLVFFLGLGLLLFFTVAITDVPFFQEGYTVYAYFPRANGLAKDSYVYYRGVKVGKVKDVSFDTSKKPQQIKVECFVFDKKVRIPINAIFKIETASLLGGSQLSIVQPDEPSSEFLADKESIEGKKQVVLMRSLETTVEDLGALIKENRESVKKTIDNFQGMSDQLNKTDNTLGAIMNERKLYDDIVTVSGKLREAAENFEKGTIGKLLSDDSIYVNFKNVSEDIRDVTQQVRSEKGNLGRLLYDDTLIKNLEETSASLRNVARRVEEGEGAIGKLLSKESEKLYDNLDSTLENIDRATAALNENSSSFSRLLYDSGALFENIEDFSRSLKSVGEKIDGKDSNGNDLENPSTIAKLLDDDGSLFSKAEGALDNLNEAIGGLAKLETHMIVGYHYFTGQDYSRAKIGLRVVPRRTRFLEIAGSYITPYDNETITYDQDKIDQGHAYVFMDVLLGQVFFINTDDLDPWNDWRIILKGGLLEGKFGGAIDVDFLRNLRLSVEARYTHKDDKFDENIDFFLGRAYMSMRMFKYFRVYGGVDNFADHGALMLGVTAEWEDEDVKSFVGLATLGN